MSLLHKGKQDPKEDLANTVCSCPECGYEAAHKRGKPCVDQYCPKCGAKMQGKSKTTAKGLWIALGNMLFGESNNAPDVEQPTAQGAEAKGAIMPSDIEVPQRKEMVLNGSIFTVQKEGDPRPRWVSISSTGFLDREGDIVSSKALKKDIERNPTDRGPLRFWHHEGIQLGTCDYAAVEGLCLIESGLWDNTPVGLAAAAKTSESPAEWGTSIGFVPNEAILGKKLNGKEIRLLFTDVSITERSQLPMNWAANGDTAMLSNGGQQMDDRQLEAFKALVGEDVAEATLSKAEAVNSKAMDPMAVYKSLDMSQLVLQLKGLAELKTRIGADEEAGVFSQAAGILEKDAAPEPEPTPSDEMDDVIKALLESGNDEAAGKLQRLKESLFADVASVKATDEEDDEEEDEEEVTETSKESNSISPSAVDAQLKEYADRLALVERAVRERDVSVTQRAASRPTRMVSNINKNATPLAEKERGESRSETIVAGMSNAMIETILGGGSPNG